MFKLTTCANSYSIINTHFVAQFSGLAIIKAKIESWATKNWRKS
jgi:hypothetical protein